MTAATPEEIRHVTQSVLDRPESACAELDAACHHNDIKIASASCRMVRTECGFVETASLPFAG